MSASSYLSNLQHQLTGSLWRARLYSAVHGLVVIASMLALTWWVHRSVEEATVHLASMMLALAFFGLRAASGAAAQNACQTLGEQAEQLARDTLQWSWQQAEDGSTAAQIERANLMVEPVERLYAYFARFQPQLWVACTTPLAILLVVAWLDWIAALFLLLSAPLIPVFMALVGMGAERLNQQHLATTQRLAGLFVDRVRGLTNLQLFSATDKAVNDIAGAGDDMRQANMATLRIAFLSSAVLEFFSAVAIAAVAIYVGFALLGYYSIGPAASLTFFAGLSVLVLAPEFFQPLRTLSAHYHDRASALAAADLLDREQRRAKKFADYSVPQHGSDLRIEHLSFTYPGSRLPAIEDFSLRARPGQLVLLNGPSGSGKSTLLKLLTGQLALSAAEAHQRVELPCMDHIAYMAQQPYFVFGSLADNLRLVKADASDEQLHQALAFAELTLPLETSVYERGQGLSGGEQRRLALARMHLQPSPLMLFDEPTAALDGSTARSIIDAIVGLKKRGHIVLVASHEPEFEAVAEHIIADLSGGDHVAPH
ncbi:ABC transporter ATP-binding protein/permease [Aliidiomarina soli]|uniref:Thiol reductant ABC exporter subunit CydD n=1 Tax=Aliidiomarina soli TaxID=1928574 RepID=A0A432WFN6_9GAMM|nr:ATP-binding cassette domain-containing protein [Aliidiomarina soli]RUO32584.1 thiol reductant ABC exporter subunit CydD [Aliidiomarina soli]